MGIDAFEDLLGARDAQITAVGWGHPSNVRTIGAGSFETFDEGVAIGVRFRDDLGTPVTGGFDDVVTLT